MFLGEAKNVGNLRLLLNAKMNLYTSMLENLKTQAEMDAAYAGEHGDVTFHHQAHWLGWYAIELPVAAFTADQAARVLIEIKDAADGDAIPERIKSEALRNVLSSMKLGSRSTSAASNLAEDAVRAFWVELGSIVLTK